MKNIFIFVVCGDKEHIETLHFSLKYLTLFSKNDILVLTDSSRNVIPIKHEKVVDVKTPIEFNNHQASIYLKTGIFKFVPKGNLYCYIDTDVIAMSVEVDKVFHEFKSPIIFGPDHSLMDQFSPYAVNCPCLEENNNFLQKFNDKLDELDEYRTSKNIEIIEARREWYIAYSNVNSNFFSKFFFLIKYFFQRNKFYLTDEIYCDRKNKIWIKNKNGIKFMRQLNLIKICKELGLKWSLLNMEPITKSGLKIWRVVKCNHLKVEIKKKFNINVDKKFQHWNGGVFLFNDNSHHFLNEWHNSTLEIFKDKNWKTRDQGTLIKTVWQFGMQNHPVLNEKWNLIADFHNSFLEWEKESIRISSNKLFKPAFVHVYHHFGDENWGFWNKLIDKINEQT